jgi:hypothetical protein
MFEYDVLLGDDPSESLDVADEKTERVCKGETQPVSGQYGSVQRAV